MSILAKSAQCRTGSQGIVYGRIRLETTAQRKAPPVGGVQRILQRIWKNGEIPLKINTRSSPLFGTGRDIAYTCNVPQLVAKCCNSKGLRHFLFWTLLVVSICFTPL
jgi:hypothetical protein